MADAAASALGECWQRLVAHNSRGRGTTGDVSWLVSAVDLALFNGVTGSAPSVDPASLDAAIDKVVAFDVPYRVDVRAAAVDAVRSVLAARGLTEVERTPAMVLDDAAGLAACAARGAAGTDLLGSDGLGPHVELASAVFGLPVDEVRTLLPDSRVTEPGLFFRVAQVDGRPVGTAMSMLAGGAVGVFNVAVLEQYRGRGIGRDLTAAVVADGVAAGARWAFLQSSRAGLPVYSALGFRTVDTWSTWMPAAG